jgi:hypothetical protein
MFSVDFCSSSMFLVSAFRSSPMTLVEQEATYDGGGDALAVVGGGGWWWFGSG